MTLSSTFGALIDQSYTEKMGSYTININHRRVLLFYAMPTHNIWAGMCVCVCLYVRIYVTSDY